MREALQRHALVVPLTHSLGAGHNPIQDAGHYVPHVNLKEHHTIQVSPPSMSLPLLVIIILLLLVP